MELIDYAEKNNSITGKIREFNKLLNFILILMIAPMLMLVSIGFARTNVLIMGAGCAFLSIPILLNFFRDNITEKVIVRYAVEQASERLKIMNKGYVEGRLSLDEYLDGLRDVTIPDLDTAAPDHLAVARVLSNNDYGANLLEAAVNVAENIDVKKYFVLEEAITKDVIKISPTTYYDETNKYLATQRAALNVEPHFNSLLNTQRKKFVAQNKSIINQMNYNIKELYKIKEERNEQEYRRRYEEMMSSSWITESK